MVGGLLFHFASGTAVAGGGEVFHLAGRDFQPIQAVQ